MLFLVATPIGNLKDITLRALEVLRSVDVIYAEDTRVVAKLLAAYEIRKPVHRYDEHSHTREAQKIVESLQSGRSIALVSDAGTPGIADPGARLIAYVREVFPECPIHPIPGASAVITALSASGIVSEEFVFLGYAPHKKGRKTFFSNMKESPVWPVVFYESPHRIIKALESIQSEMGGATHVCIARELTKIHEDIFSGKVSDAITHIRGPREKGEFAVIVQKK